MAYHRYILRVSFKSWASLVWHQVNKLFLFSKTISAEYASLAALLKPLHTRTKPPNPNQIIFFFDEKFLNRMKMPAARMADSCVLTMRMFPLSCTTRTSWRPTWWTTGNVEMWPPSSTDCNPLDYFMWCVVEREVNKCPHKTLSPSRPRSQM